MQCVQCEENFRNESLHNKHHEDKHRGEPYICQICKVELKDNSVYRKHKWTNHNKPYACDYCKFTSTKTKLMRNHVLKKHNEKLKVKEQVNKQHAYKKITGKSNIIESDKEKENDDLEVLNVVTKSVDKNIVESTAPPENETDNLENPVKCKLCIHRFANNHQLVQHMKQNHIQALIHEHIENTKLDGPRLQEEGAANVDQTEVKEESAEQEHQNENDDDFWDNDVDDSDNDPDFIPDKDELNSTTNELDSSFKTIVSKYPKGSMKCAKCNLVLRNKKTLYVHQIKEHGYMAFKCPISTCDGQFTSELRLKQHIGTLFIYLK